jgi:protein involved in polysaccharide export with SLBB domain
MKKSYRNFLFLMLLLIIPLMIEADQSWFDPIKSVISGTNPSSNPTVNPPVSNNTNTPNPSNGANSNQTQLISAPQTSDYANNLKSNVFGANLFTGTFANQGATHFNPKYRIAVGDNLDVKLWGAFDYQASLTVDPKGNIFVPNIGPLKVMGVRNDELQKIFDLSVSRIFKSNVYSYINLAAAQPVKIFVSGYVSRPGLYGGTSMDNLLHFLDQAGGIDPDRGSFLNIKIMRGQQERSLVNLYDFLLMGIMPMIQLSDGDVILVEPRQKTISVTGLADNPNLFEFSEDVFHMSELIKLARPKAVATHARVTRNQGIVKNIEYYPLTDISSLKLTNGDEIEFTADKKPGSVTVRVEGEHLSPQEYVLAYGAKLGDVLNKIQYSERSDKENIQLFRLSVHDRQKQIIQTSLQNLQNVALNAKSSTNDEASLRKDEAGLILQWIDRAKSIEPTGQVVISQSTNKDDLLLENGDILRVPTKDGLVLVGGEVLFPNAVAFQSNLTKEDYIRKAGGFSQNADSSKIIIARVDGSFDENSEKINSGDQILVLPKIDVKSRQVFKEMTQIMYQIAVSAKVVFGL